MKRFIYALFFVFALTGLSVTAVYAGADCAPGCNCAKNPNYDPNDPSQGGYYSSDSVFGAQEEIAKAEQVKEKAYTNEIIKQPDNAPGMTCLDRAMGLTASLGNIFSDKFPQEIPGASTSIFGSVTFPDAGTGANSGADAGTAPGKAGPYGAMLKNVVSENLKKYAKNFEDTGDRDGSLSFQLGATNLGAMDALGGLINGALSSTGITNLFNQINDIIGTVGGVLGTINGAWSQYGGYFDTAMGFFGLSGLAGVVGQIFNVLGNVESLVSQVANLFGNLQGALMGLLSNLISIDHLTQGGTQDCNRIAKLWGDGSFGKALTGTGNDKGAPYFRLKDMLSGQNMPSSLGQNLMKAFDTDNSVLQAAFNVLDTGILSGPGSSAIWPATPIIPENASVDDIIAQMN